MVDLGLLKELRQEWPAVRAARWVIIVACLGSAGLGFAFASLLSNSTIATLRERLDLYKDRLQGASPDEAGKQIEQLKKQVADLLVASRNPWQLTPVEKEIITAT